MEKSAWKLFRAFPKARGCFSSGVKASVFQQCGAGWIHGTAHPFPTFPPGAADGARLGLAPLDPFMEAQILALVMPKMEEQLLWRHFHLKGFLLPHSSVFLSLAKPP